MKVAQLCLTLCHTIDYTVHGILQARILEWVAFPFSKGSSQPRDQTQVSHIAGGFFTSRVTGKPKNTGVGCLSLLQWIFPTQESNRGPLHCRRILPKSIPYEYTMEVTNTFKRVDLIDRVPEELWTEVCDRRQRLIPSQRNRNAERQNDCLKRSYK